MRSLKLRMRDYSNYAVALAAEQCHGQPQFGMSGPAGNAQC
jgi:hypothetical protein